KRSCWFPDKRTSMYERFYGFREPAFDLTANPRFLYFTPQHREALSHLEYGMSAAKPVTLLIGEAGTGKSTLLRAALASEMCKHVRCLFIDNPTVTRAEFFELLASKFDVAGVGRSKVSLLGAFESIVRRRQSRNETTALVVDEAQSVPDEVLEE